MTRESLPFQTPRGLWGVGLGQSRFSVGVVHQALGGASLTLCPQARSPWARGLGTSQEPGPQDRAAGKPLTPPLPGLGSRQTRDPALPHAGLMGPGSH